jgi:hypothetical protein
VRVLSRHGAEVRGGGKDRGTLPGAGGRAGPQQPYAGGAEQPEARRESQPEPGPLQGLVQTGIAADEQQVARALGAAGRVRIEDPRRHDAEQPDGGHGKHRAAAAIRHDPQRDRAGRGRPEREAGGEEHRRRCRWAGELRGAPSRSTAQQQRAYGRVAPAAPCHRARRRQSDRHGDEQHEGAGAGSRDRLVGVGCPNRHRGGG